MKMDLNYIKKLIKILDSSNVAEIEIEEEGTKLRLSKPKSKNSVHSLPINIPSLQSQVPLENISAEKVSDLNEAPAEALKAHKTDNLYEVKSPMVGTLYRSPSPEADPYVNVGSYVSPGTVLCIIEAMKLMNEIESEVSGKIVKILVENAQPIEYNQSLFIIEKS